jgi:adenosylcobinamide-GDP ribazoletransferase
MFYCHFDNSAIFKTQLGGLTGDTYGALTECGNVIYLLTAVFLLR